MDLITDEKNTKQVEGIFHNLSEDMRVSLANMCIEDEPSAHSTDRLYLSKQRTENIREEELLCDKTVLSVSENFIDVLYYNKKFILCHVGTLLLQLTGM